MMLSEEIQAAALQAISATSVPSGIACNYETYMQLKATSGFYWCCGHPATFIGLPITIDQRVDGWTIETNTLEFQDEDA